MDAVLYAALKNHVDKRIDESLQSTAPIYGVYWNKGEDPTLTRTHDAVGMTANAGVDGQYVQNDFDNAQIYREIGEVTDEYGNVFIRIPKCYIRKTDGDGFKTWQVSKFKYPGFYLPWCFWDFATGRELPYVDVGKYKASLSGDGKLESKPDVYPLVSKNIVDFRAYAQANGPGYQQLDIHVVDVLQTLFYVEFATLNSQSVMSGYTTGQYSDAHVAALSETGANRVVLANAYADQYRVGQAISVGTSLGGNQVCYGRTIIAIETVDVDNKALVFDGDPVDIAAGNFVNNTGWKNGFSANVAASSGSIANNTDGKYPCVYRGIESLWGDIWQFVDGVNIDENRVWVCKNAADYASNVFAYPYEQMGYVNANVNGYPTQMGHDPSLPFAAFPTTVGGTATTYYSDYYYQTTGQRIALVGGYWPFGSAAGLSAWSLGTLSGSTPVIVGGRLLKKPL